MSSWTAAKIEVISGQELVSRAGYPIAGDRYEGVADFGKLSENPWTVLIVFDQTPPGSQSIRGTATLRAKWAPRELFSRGNRFNIIEGDKVVATAEVVENGYQVEAPPL